MSDGEQKTTSATNPSKGRHGSHAGRSHRSGPPRGVRSGYRWWAYALLILVAICALGLVVGALLIDR